MAIEHHFGDHGGMTVANNLERLRLAANLSRPKLAALMNTSAQQIEKLEKGLRKLSPEWIGRAADALGVPATALISEGELPPTNARTVNLEGSSLERLREDLPIYGTALGAPKIVEGEAIEQTWINSGETIGYAKRPAILNGQHDAYAVYTVGHSMAPKYDEGDMLVAQRKRPARIGDDVVVYLRCDGEEDDGKRARAVLVKRLVRRSASYVELEQFNPPLIFRIPADQIVQIDRIMTMTDLLG